MNNYLILLPFLFCTIAINASAEKKDFATFKNKTCGYQFSYPSDWVATTDDEQTDASRMEISPDEAYSITMNSGEEKRQHCKFHYECLLTVICHGDGTASAYKKQINWINDYVKFEKRMNPPKTRIVELKLNDHKVEIVLRELHKEYFGLNAYFYCEKSNMLFDFATKKQYDSEFNIITDLSKPVTLENMYTSDQLMIINSFKCPGKNFVYKKFTAKKKK